METWAVPFKCLLVEMEKRVRPKSTTKGEVNRPQRNFEKGDLVLIVDDRVTRLEHGPSCRRTPGSEWTSPIGQSYHGNNGPRSPN